MLRNPSRIYLKQFSGLNSYISRSTVTPQWWIDSSNISVNANGSAEVLRSLKRFNTALSTSNPIISVADFLNPTEHRFIYDINLSTGTHVATYCINDDTTNTQLRTGQADAPFASLVVNSWLYRVNGSEYIQLGPDVTPTPLFYKVGITGPAAAPTISYVAGGSTGIAEGIQVSYAYKNSTTGHVSSPSPLSNRLGATTTDFKVRIPTVASAETGVDKIVFFITLDGGAVPYLIVESDGDVYEVSNATGNTDLDVSTLYWDNLTPEPIYNDPPPVGARSLFKWKDRVFLLNFAAGNSAGIPFSAMVYSGFESTYIGNPWESYPPLNQINVGNKGEELKAGIGTQLGALVLSTQDAYLLAGYPTDKTQGPEAQTGVSEHLEFLHWQIGTQSPRTLKNTPFGTIWLDQNQRLRLWTGEGFPNEIGLPLREELDGIDATKLDKCEGEWFQHGKNGGYYVMCGTTTAAAQKLYFVTIYQNPENGEVSYGFGTSDDVVHSISTVYVSGRQRLFLGCIDSIKETFNPDLAGDGWSAGQERFFEIMIGNDTNYAYWHSIRVDGSINGLTLIIKDQDGTNEKEIFLEQDSEGGGSWFGMIDEYAHRKILRFEFDDDDSEAREINAVQIMYQVKNRML